MRVKIINKSKHQLPQYSTAFSAGMDIRANLDKPVKIKPLERILIPTGLYLELPRNYEAQTRPRSGLALEKGVSILNTPGTIDSDYRGEIRIILINLSETECEIRDGERICQMIITRHETISWEEVQELNSTERGPGGFGHTGQ